MASRGAPLGARCANGRSEALWQRSWDRIGLSVTYGIGPPGRDARVVAGRSGRARWRKPLVARRGLAPMALSAARGGVIFWWIWQADENLHPQAYFGGVLDHRTGRHRKGRRRARRRRLAS